MIKTGTQFRIQRFRDEHTMVVDKADPCRIPATCKEHEDARRVAACLNACTSISTELLEEFPAGLNGISAVAIAKQRDELLDAIKSIQDYMTSYPYDMGLEGFAASVIAKAITKCEVPHG